MKKANENKNVYRSIGINNIAAPRKQASPVKSGVITGKHDLRAHGGRK